jgi:hypothetical protein
VVKVAHVETGEYMGFVVLGSVKDNFQFKMTTNKNTEI